MTGVADHLERMESRIRKLANRLGWTLLRADSDEAYSALVAAAGLFLSDPDMDKENAVEQARSFGEHVAEHIKEHFEVDIETRRKVGL